MELKYEYVNKEEVPSIAIEHNLLNRAGDFIHNEKVLWNEKPHKCCGITKTGYSCNNNSFYKVDFYMKIDNHILKESREKYGEFRYVKGYMTLCKTHLKTIPTTMRMLDNYLIFTDKVLKVYLEGAEVNRYAFNQSYRLHYLLRIRNPLFVRRNEIRLLKLTKRIKENKVKKQNKKKVKKITLEKVEGKTCDFLYHGRYRTKCKYKTKYCYEYEADYYCSRHLKVMKYKSKMVNYNTEDAIKGYEKRPKNETNDCVVNSIACGFDITYMEAWNFCKDFLDRKPCKGTRTTNMNKDMDLFGKKLIWLEVPTKLTIMDFLEEENKGTYILTERGHMFCIKDGVVYGNKNECDKLNKHIRKLWKIE